MTWLERNISLHSYDNKQDERLNGLTHLFGAILSFIALLYMTASADGNMIAPAIIYGMTMLMLYSSSSLYHYLPKSDAKRFCRVLDHSNIYFLIAGTYTPIMVYLSSPKSYFILFLVWAIAILGIVFTLVFWGRLKALHLILYIAMGWLIVFFYNDTIVLLNKNFMKYIFTGGVLYTVGVIFYAIKKIPHYHAIWHIFCILGSLSFFIGIIKYLI